MRPGAPLIVLALALPAGPVAAQSPVAGSWKLDKRRSELSGGMRDNQAAIEQVMTIEQDGNRFSVSTHTTGGPLGAVWDNTIIPVDGRQHPFTSPGRVNGTGGGVRSARWLPDRSGFEVEEKVTRVFNGIAVAVTNAHTWTTSPDGLTLTVESVTHGPHGVVRTRRVFVRQHNGSEA